MELYKRTKTKQLSGNVAQYCPFKRNCAKFLRYHGGVGDSPVDFLEKCLQEFDV